jgi:type II secretory pathway pseudopilin PulG
MRGLRASSGAAAGTAGGFTIVELLVVLLVLVGLAGVAISVSGVAWNQAESSLGLTQLVEAQKAVQRFEFDNRRWPMRLSELSIQPADLPAHDPIRGFGWRGPYLSPVRGVYAVDAEQGFLADYGNSGDPVPLDLFDRALVLQRPDAQGRYLRVVSAGANGKLETPAQENYPARSICGDDALLYIREADLRP